MQNSTLQFANNYEIVLAAIKNNDLALEDASDASEDVDTSEELKNDKVSDDKVSDDVSKCGLLFKYAS